MALHGNLCGRERTIGVVTVGGNFLEKFTFPFCIKCLGCLGATLSTAFNEEMTSEQYFDS